MLSLWSAWHLRQNRDFFFLHSGNYSLKFDFVKLFGLECSINPQGIMKIVKAIFLEKRNFNFFLSELPFILRADRKRKKKLLEIFARELLDKRFE